MIEMWFSLPGENKGPNPGDNLPNPMEDNGVTQKAELGSRMEREQCHF